MMPQLQNPEGYRLFISEIGIAYDEEVEQSRPLTEKDKEFDKRMIEKYNLKPRKQ